ncbi:oligoendopeptidase F [Evansella sp. AB-P1]|uniref:oligoendopeptidase F n=1 Tax=Evansella sp. AB-P1 TaxID=3037653 RepID=UPI00241E2FA1|nr:oligoendopeptidase F [Evansella sp. AB-P1]MDG5789529.1 oligoendopeptidase F [Evansella sp. AB-P1]
MNTYTSRQEIPSNEKWNLEDIFNSVSEWENNYHEVEKLAEKLKNYEDNINNGNDLYLFLKQKEELHYIFKKVYVYAMLHVDVDTRDSEAQSLLDRASQLSVKVSSATAFFMPFLLSLKESTLKEYILSAEKLTYFEDDLFEAYRFKPHVLLKEKEEVLSQMGEALASPSKTFGMINNADIKFGEVTTDEGQKVELTRGMYSKLIEDENRDKRKEAYKAYYKPYVQLNNSIASTLSAAIKNNVLISRIRNYPSALEKSLFADNIPLNVYHNLIESTKKNIQPYHEYTKLRKKILGVDELRQFDLNVPLVKGVKQSIPYDDAYDTMLQALQPLGKEYVDTLHSFKEKRYIDVRETPGKRSGAYNLGLFGVHPFVLLNHQDDLDSLFTLTHEMGHAMHSYYSNRHQPQITANYTIFVAEVASTVNEVLLINYLIKNSTKKKVQRHLVNHFIDKFKGTFFTQVMFSEFEKKTHEMVEKGEPINGDVFNKTYELLFREYHGDALVFDEEVKYGWSRIPHFYRPFYVYKYATGFAAAIQIANKLLDGEKETITSYLTFLKSGSSDYPLELLKKTGVDLTSQEPIENALKSFSQLVEQFSSF